MTWFKPGFVLIHVAVGCAVGWALWLLGAPTVAIVVATLAMGIAKEWGEEPSDIIGSGNGQPWNGIVDIIAFALGPAVWWIVQ